MGKSGGGISVSGRVGGQSSDPTTYTISTIGQGGAVHDNDWVSTLNMNWNMRADCSWRGLRNIPYRTRRMSRRGEREDRMA